MRALKTTFDVFLAATLIPISDGHGADLFRQQSGIDGAVAQYGVSGKGVVIAILDRGIQWQNPDFINASGRTRIKWLLDMSGQNWCDSNNPDYVEYSENQINLALAGGKALKTRDAVGHGTVTAGIAAGNGRAFPRGKYIGAAPEADLVIVKMTSEGAPSHGDQSRKKL
jgi:subtilisin family serine protease